MADTDDQTPITFHIHLEADKDTMGRINFLKSMFEGAAGFKPTNEQLLLFLINKVYRTV